MGRKRKQRKLRQAESHISGGYGSGIGMVPSSPSGGATLNLPSYNQPRQPSIMFVSADEETGGAKTNKNELPPDIMPPQLMNATHSKIESESAINLDQLQPDIFAQFNV